MGGDCNIRPHLSPAPLPILLRLLVRFLLWLLVVGLGLIFLVFLFLFRMIFVDLVLSLRTLQLDGDFHFRLVDDVVFAKSLEALG